MHLGVFLATFAVILPAELPDKSLIAAVVLGAKYRPAHVFAGVAAAFAAQVAIAVLAGQVLGLLPRRLLEVVVAVLFALGAVMLIREHGAEPEAKTAVAHQPDRPPFWKVGALAFGIVFAAEFGDLTQIATANLVAKFHDPWSVAAGAVLALWTAAAIGIWGGRRIVRILPMALFTRVAAALLGLLAAASLVSAVVS